MAVFLAVRRLPTPRVPRARRLHVHAPLAAVVPNFYQVGRVSYGGACCWGGSQLPCGDRARRLVPVDSTLTPSRGAKQYLYNKIEVYHIYNAHCMVTGHVCSTRGGGRGAGGPG